MKRWYHVAYRKMLRPMPVVTVFYKAVIMFMVFTPVFKALVVRPVTFVPMPR